MVEVIAMAQQLVLRADAGNADPKRTKAEQLFQGTALIYI